MDLNNELLHTPDGMRDTYGTEMAKKSEIMNRIRSRIRLYGYEEIQTPTIEFYDVFSSEVGTTPVKELYKLLDNEGNLLVLRPEGLVFRSLHGQVCVPSCVVHAPYCPHAPANGLGFHMICIHDQIAGMIVCDRDGGRHLRKLGFFLCLLRF